MTEELRQPDPVERCPVRPCAAGELRCACGSLLARLVGGAVELKCRRCKRTWRVPLRATR